MKYCAIKLRRQGLGIELNGEYWRDGVAYCAAAAAERDTPTLFDLLDREGGRDGRAS